MTRLDTATRASLILAALCVSVASIIAAVSMTTRTTPAGEGVVYRQNLITGGGEFCFLRQGGVTCFPTEAPDFSDRAIVAE